MDKKILVIDDEPNIVRMVKSRLEASNYEVITAFDGEEGLRKAQDENPDLIICDVVMPKMDGYTFVQELKRLGFETPVIVLTRKDKLRDLFELAGVKDYIVKPFRGEELLEKIEKHLR